MTWRELYDRALASDEAAAGNYNRNVRVATVDGTVNVRIPLAAADAMDVRLWREEEVLARIEPYVGRIPELRHVSGEPRFQVHRFIEGRVLDGFSPRHSPVPGHLLDDVVTLMDQLTRVPSGAAPALSARWPAPGDTAAFGRLLAGLTYDIHSAHGSEYGEVFAALGVPEDPLAVVESRWDTLTPRPFAVLHGDLHRKNMIVSDGKTWFLDWELALWGDPMYEIGIHFHKMDYPQDQRTEVLRRWRERLPARYTAGPDADLDLYLAHEQIKSAIVDTIRYSRQSAAATDPDRKQWFVGRLTRTVNTARRVWGSPADLTHVQVAEALAPWWKV
ncbi:phosphotransferase family protein [Streptomyces venezuelae]|uniref:phosphotransferase family protein n=1 Tax=Streptomyces venezuelae TaxID=54571 RepID=UPI0033246175